MTHHLLLKPSAFPKLAKIIPVLLPDGKEPMSIKACYLDRDGNLNVILHGHLDLQK